MYSLDFIYFLCLWLVHYLHLYVCTFSLQDNKIIECNDDESSNDETEPLAARIAKQSRTTKAKVKYTLSDDDNDDDIDDNNNDGKVSSEDEWMEIRSSDSEDELSIIQKVQKQPSKNKKAVKFATSTKDQNKMDTGDSQTTGVVKDAVVEDEAADEIKIMDNLELPSVAKPLTDSKQATNSKPPAEKPKKKAATKKQPKQDKGSKKTTQTTLFDTGVKLKAGAKRKTAPDAEQEASSSLPKKPAKQPPKPKVIIT